MRRLFSYMPIVAVAVLFSLFSCQSKKGEKQSGDVRLPEISVAYPAVDSVVLIKSYPGYLTSLQTVDLVARVNGYLQQVAYMPGEIVKKGQLLFVIEPSQYEDAVEQAEAALKTAQAQYDYAENNYTRMKEAAQSDAISTIDLIQAESKLEQSRASVRNAEAALSTARIQLGYCYVKAPFEGRISRNLYDVGNYISGSLQSTKLATIYQDKKMYAYFNIEDNQYLKMLLNQSKGKHSVPSDRVEILFQEPTSRSYYGRLDYLSPNVDLSTGTLSIRAEVDNPDGELKSGLYISIRLPYGSREHAILVRDASIATDQLGKYMYVVNDSNVVEYRPVETGQLVNDTLRVIDEGISPPDRYVTKALLKVRAGMPVRPVLEKN